MSNVQMKLDETTAALWHLSKTLSIVQAAILMIDRDPSQIELYWDFEQNQPVLGTEHSRLFLPAFSMLKGAANEYNGLRAFIRRDKDGSDRWDLSSVYVDTLREFLHKRGVRGGFFSPVADTWNEPKVLVERKADIGFRDPQHEYYAPELALAVAAWEAISKDYNAKRSPKENLRDWVQANWQSVWTETSARAPSKEAVERIATLANWKPSGGAPKSSG